MSDPVVPTSTAGSPASPQDVEAFNRHLKGYLFIGGLQVVFTFIAVLCAFLVKEMHAKIVMVLLAASINAGIVALIQMHLKVEKPFIWRFLYFTGAFFFVLFFLTLFHWFDPISGSFIHH